MELLSKVYDGKMQSFRVSFRNGKSMCVSLEVMWMSVVSGYDIQMS